MNPTGDWAVDYLEKAYDTKDKVPAEAKAPSRYPRMSCHNDDLMFNDGKPFSQYIEVFDGAKVICKFWMTDQESDFPKNLQEILKKSRPICGNRHRYVSAMDLGRNNDAEAANASDATGKDVNQNQGEATAEADNAKSIKPEEPKDEA